MRPLFVSLRCSGIRRVSRWILALVLGCSVAAPGRALAATRSVNFCFQYNVSYEDDPSVAFDDGFANGIVPARAASASVTPPSYPPANPAFQGYLGSGDSDNCTGTLLLTIGETYTIKLKSAVQINGNTILVYQEAGATTLWSHVAALVVTSTTPGTITLTTPVDEGWNIAAIAGYALFRHDSGTTGNTYRFYSDGSCGSSDCCPGGTSCNSGGYIYIADGPSSVHYDNRYVILHEMGHRVAQFANGDASTNFDYDLATGPTDACPGGLGHNRGAWEWQSAAVNEGIAHFWADVVLNDASGGDCAAYSHSPVDWDNDTFTDGQDYDCNGAPVGGLGLSVSNWLDDVCPTDAHLNSGNEYDWERFWWDLVADEGLSVGTIMDIWDGANPHDWYAAGVFTGPNYPAQRLKASAAAIGAACGTAYDTQDNYNGVAR